MSGIPIRAGRFVVGQVCGDTFYKRVRTSAHFLQRPPAIAFDVSSLDDAEREGAQYVQVTDAESGKVYRASISHVRAKGFEFNRGFGKQIALPLADWSRDAEQIAEQLSMWGEAA